MGLNRSFVTVGLLAVSMMMGQAAIAAVSVYDVQDSEANMDLFEDGKIYLIVRADDMGFCHACNAGFEQVMEEGVLTAASVIVNTPWLDEAVEILSRHPEVSVGVHTCLNSEWVPYRWGPVLGADRVPSLVDEWGNFFGTRADLQANNPDMDEFEAEIRAQIDLALRKGLNLSYIDHHMSAAVETPEMRRRFEQIADDYGLAISRYFGEQIGAQIYSTPIEEKADSLIDQISAITEPGLYITVHHVLLDQPEVQVLRDLNASGLAEMSRHRQAEADALCDPRLRQVIEERGIELIGYDVLRDRFRDRMVRPE